jgi:hypothetical protein
MAVARLDITTTGLDAMAAILDPARFRKDVTAGLRYASSGVKTTAAKEIGARYTLTAARIKQDIRKPQASGDAITIRFGRRPPTLRGYSGRPLAPRGGNSGRPLARGGISYSVFRGQREKRSDVFWLPIGGAPGLPFRRVKPGRQGMIVLYGPSVGSIFAGKSLFGESIRGTTTAKAQEQFIKGIERELARRSRGF